MAKCFIPFHDIRKYDRVLVVDSHHPAGFTLSHWRGALIRPDIHDATSTGIVLNAISKGIPELSYPYVTNNHFDIDGFLGVWALHNPLKASKYDKVLRQMALIGDFREFDAALPESDLALKLVCWINTVEKKHFYSPFEAPEYDDKEARLCVTKYVYFLDYFGKVLEDPEPFRFDWVEEYEQVEKDLACMKSPETAIHDYYDLGLRVIHTPEPLHYYALFQDSEDFTAVLSMYEGRRYELEYKYTTWVDTGRLSYPRIKLEPLAARLSAQEPDGITWCADSIFDTGPILRVDKKRLTKAQRFNHPRHRDIATSGLDKRIVLKTILEYFKYAQEGVDQKNFWTWQDMRKVNESLSLG